MNQPLNRRAAVLILLFSYMAVSAVSENKNNSNALVSAFHPIPRIQVAILLDVSNSMDGLIEQAKTQLWNMVKILGRVNCNGVAPQIEIALYEYGRPQNDVKEGYVKQISPFTNNLDELFRQLTALTTNGGDEYCGHVLYNSLTQLNWDSSDVSYKVIFIAGNESFLQGDISYTKACEQAKARGVIVNTIYCGDKQQGINENWNLGAECGNGSFTNIDQQAKPASISSPYDSTLIVLKGKLTQTYVPYGEKGMREYNSMALSDTQAVYSMNDPTKTDHYVINNYISVKANSRLFNNPEWDLVDAMEKDTNIIRHFDKKTLPDSLQNKTETQLKKIIETKTAERALYRNAIADFKSKQESFIAAEKAKVKSAEPQTLESEIERIIREQVKRYNMMIKEN
jgi:von Willebrand factor type A domain